MYSIGVLMTCHNRRDKTLACLAKLYGQALPPHHRLEVYLVDDGSTDQTGPAVASQYPAVRLIAADGSLFWNRGMHRAAEVAFAADHDFYLWLNDDTLLDEGALGMLLTAHYQQPADAQATSVWVGATYDERTGQTSYGGYQRLSRWHPFRYRIVEPNGQVQTCTTMCGNCVLFTREVVRRIGNIHPAYHHRWGDVDYGLRARNAGCEVYTPGQHVGRCDENPLSTRWTDRRLTLRQRWREVNSMKGLHREDWRTFTQLHGGPFWWFFWSIPYVKIAATGLVDTCKRSLTWQRYETA